MSTTLSTPVSSRIPHANLNFRLPVLLLYDYTITFGREVETFWMRRFSGATLLFFANKYISLLNHLFDLSLFIPIPVSDKVRPHLSTAHLVAHAVLCLP